MVRLHVYELPYESAYDLLQTIRKESVYTQYDVARTVCGSSRMDHVQVEDVLARADYLSANKLAVKATA
jgi:hypothetical protein